MQMQEGIETWGRTILTKWMEVLGDVTPALSFLPDEGFFLIPK
jgi:hypothetical protein